jgi:hypothetical protein
LRKNIRDEDCFVRIAGRKAFSVWSSSMGLQGEPPVTARSFPEAAQWLKGERKSLYMVMMNIMRKLQREMTRVFDTQFGEPKERAAAVAASAARSARAAERGDDSSESGAGEDENEDEDYEAEPPARSPAASAVASVAAAVAPVASPPAPGARVLFHDAPSSIEVMKWGSPMFRVDSRSPEVMFFRVGMVMAQTMGHMRVVLTCDSAEIVAGKPRQQFRAWKYGAAEAVESHSSITRALQVSGRNVFDS